MSSLNALNGVPCGTGNTGTTRVVYGADGGVSIFCDAPPEQTPQPVYISVSVAGNLATVTFNRVVCRAAPWSAVDWEITANGVSSFYEDVGDGIPFCNAAGDNGVTSANLVLISAPAPGSLVAVTLTTFGGAAMHDADGVAASAPQTRTATATAPETTPPMIASAAGAPGSTVVTLTFSEPVYCIGLSFDSSDIVITDNNPVTTDPVAVGQGPNGCGFTQSTADTSFSVQFSAPLLGGTDYTIFVLAEANEIQDVFGNDLANPSSANFSTGPADIGNPTITDTQLISNLATTDFGEVGDSFESTFSEPMNGSTSGAISLQDADGTGTFLLICGVNSSCTWNTAVTTLTVTLITNWVGTGGTTPGMQIPVTITTMSGFTDTSGNVVNLTGSADRIIDNELFTGPFAPPTVTDARVLANFGTTDFESPGDSFSATFSHAMVTSASRILLQDQDGSFTNLECGTFATCVWDVAATKLTVTIMLSIVPSGGTTPGLQIPVRIAMLAGVFDPNGNVPDLAGSADTLIDYE